MDYSQYYIYNKYKIDLHIFCNYYFMFSNFFDAGCNPLFAIAIVYVLVFYCLVP